MAPSPIRDQVQKYIASSRLAEAADLLARTWNGKPGALSRMALSLQRRLDTLESQLSRGVIAHSDADLERNRITEGLLFLADRLDDERLQAPAHLLESVPRPRTARWWAIGGALLALAFLSFLLWPRQAAETAAGIFDLKVYLAPESGENPDWSGARVQLRLGDLQLPVQELDRQGRTVFTGISTAFLDRPALITLFDIPYTVVGQSAVTAAESPERALTFYLAPRPDTTIWRGRVYEGADRPVAGAVVEVDQGLARDTTDASGQFSFAVPLTEGHSMEVTVWLGGRLRYHATNTLTADLPARLQLNAASQ